MDYIGWDPEVDLFCKDCQNIQRKNYSEVLEQNIEGDISLSSLSCIYCGNNIIRVRKLIDAINRIIEKDRPNLQKKRFFARTNRKAGRKARQSMSSDSNNSSLDFWL